VYLVGLRRDVEIEQYLDLEMQLERKLGNHNSCVLTGAIIGDGPSPTMAPGSE